MKVFVLISLLMISWTSSAHHYHKPKYHKPHHHQKHYSVYSTDRYYQEEQDYTIRGKIKSVNYFWKEYRVKDNRHLNSLGGAIVGGIIGNQFGGGSGKDIATAVGALVGASAAHGKSRLKYKRVKYATLKIKGRDGQVYRITQPVTRSQLFYKGQNVALVFASDGSRYVERYY